jgi:hypothetical protein
MKPHISWNIDGSREAWTVVDLPGRCSIQSRRILLGVVQTGFVWPQINLPSVWLGLAVVRPGAFGAVQAESIPTDSPRWQLKGKAKAIEY